jgi:hypothetical protein
MLARVFSTGLLPKVPARINSFLRGALRSPGHHKLLLRQARRGLNFVTPSGPECRQDRGRAVAYGRAASLDSGWMVSA